MENIPKAGVSGNLLVCLYFISKLVPMVVSGIAIYLGFKLFVLGVTGQASLAIDARTVSGQLLNAAPGLFFAIGGLVALIASVWKGAAVSFSSRGPLEEWATCLSGSERRKLQEKLDRSSVDIQL